MSKMNQYITDLTYRIMEAGHECDPYEQDWNSEEAFEETFNSIMNDLPGLICYFHMCTEDCTPELLPSSFAILEELNRIYRYQADRRYENCMFAIDPAYIEDFGSEADENTRLPYEEVKRLSKEWNVPLAVLIRDQLTLVS